MSSWGVEMVDAATTSTCHITHRRADADNGPVQVPSSPPLPRQPALFSVRTGAQILQEFVRHTEDFLRMSVLQQIVLAILAGSFIAFGAMLSTIFSTGAHATGVRQLLLGLGFAAGFVLVILSGTALFTEVNVIVPTFFLSTRQVTSLRCWGFWAISFLGNIAGSILLGALIKGGNVLSGHPDIKDRLREIITSKMVFHENGVSGWWQAFCSAILGNWLVGMAAFNATAAHTVSGKILGSSIPVIMFAALGVQHSPANMGYFAVGLVEGDMGTGVGEVLAWNIVPAALGNMVGGGIFVAFAYWYVFGGVKDSPRHPNNNDKDTDKDKDIGEHTV